MMIVVKLLGYSVLSAWILWIFYLAVMNLQRARDAGRLSLVAKIAGYPVVYIGWAIDIAFNLIVLTALMWQMPRAPWTATARFKAERDSDAWRGKVARWFARHLLDPYDPSGKHV